MGALFFLEQADESRALPLSPSQATAELAARAFTPPWERTAVARALDTCARLSRVPGARLRFRPDTSAVRAALRFLEAPASR